MNSECISQLFSVATGSAARSSIRGSMASSWRHSKGAAPSEKGVCVWAKSVREFQLINLQFLQWKFTAVKRFNMLIKSAFCRRRWFINSSFVYECVLYLRHSLSSLSTRIILTHSLTAQFSSNTNTNSQRINVACRIESASASWLVCCLPPNLVCFFGTVILLSNMSHNDLY